MAGNAMWDGVKLTAFWLITNFLSIGVGKYFNLSVIGVLFLQGLLLGLILLVFVTIIGSRVSRRVDKLEAALSPSPPAGA
jgi:hypothetical protein